MVIIEEAVFEVISMVFWGELQMGRFPGLEDWYLYLSLSLCRCLSLE